MLPDDEGFQYPYIDQDSCIDCGLCEKVCPYLNAYPALKNRPVSFACKTLVDELRDSSSSGGLFTILASKIIEENGVVFGAKFDSNWDVVHGYTETIDGLSAFRGSKYSQSDLGYCFTQAKEFLRAGKKVLFSGTPCQIAGLNHFLQKKYDNLFTIDFVCHSIPSPKVWHSYLLDICKNNKIVSITFKDKSEGWAKYGLLVNGENGVLEKGNHQVNLYMKAFLSNLIIRPSCTNCPARNYKSGADITMADCWGFNEYHPELNDDRGMSLALLLTEKGTSLFDSVLNNLDVFKIPYEEVQEESNHSPIIKSPRPHFFREHFFKEFMKGYQGTKQLLKKYVEKEEKRVKSLIRKIVGAKLIKLFRWR